MIFNRVLELAVCGPCVGQYGRWTNKLREDDGDICTELNPVNSVLDETPPFVPEVVEVVQHSDEDVSTICDVHEYLYRHEDSSSENGFIHEPGQEVEDYEGIFFDDGSSSLESILGPRPSRLHQSHAPTGPDEKKTSLSWVAPPSPPPPTSSLFPEKLQVDHCQLLPHCSAFPMPSVVVGRAAYGCDDGSSYNGGAACQRLFSRHRHTLSAQTHSTDTTLQIQNRKAQSTTRSV